MEVDVNSMSIQIWRRLTILHKSCLGCYYENDSVCYWFKIKRDSAPKKIPKDVINKGCDKYLNNVSIGYKAGNKLTDRIINVFDGEIVGEKYEPPVRERKSYKKKYVKSAHNYSYRRDAQ